jgi:metallopeptidase MepB
MQATPPIAPQAPPSIIPTEDIIPTMKRIIAQNVAIRNSILETVTPSAATFLSVIKPLADVQNQSIGKIAVVAMLRYASPDPAAREASDEAIGLMREDESRCTANTNLFRIIQAVKDRAEPLGVEEEKYLNLMLMEFTRCGQGRLSPDQIHIYLENRNHIEKLKREYNRNIRNDDAGLWLSLEELDGVPEQELARFSKRQGAEESDNRDARFVRFTRGDMNAVLQYARNPATRKKMYVANENKVPQNVPLFREAFVLRDENARRLGYASHAAFRLETHVAKTPAWVSNLLDKLEQLLLPRGQREMQILLERREQDYPNSGDSMPPWDYDYYSRLALEDLDVKHVQISEYFPVQRTVSAMFDIFASCLQLRFVPFTSELLASSIWHQDVEAWSVWDEREASKNSFIGYIYTDLLWRPGKHKGSQNVNLQCGYLKGDGTRVYPATILMCSFPRPTASGCALLKHHETVSLFHELGHGIHDLVSRTSFARFHGHKTAPDFFEIPSVILEKWCWKRDELRQMSCHYTTLNSEYLRKWQEEHPREPCPPEKIPEKMLDGLVRSSTSNKALWYLRQM